MVTAAIDEVDRTVDETNRAELKVIPYAIDKQIACASRADPEVTRGIEVRSTGSQPRTAKTILSTMPETRGRHSLDRRRWGSRRQQTTGGGVSIILHTRNGAAVPQPRRPSAWWSCIRRLDKPMQHHRQTALRRLARSLISGKAFRRMTGSIRSLLR